MSQYYITPIEGTPGNSISVNRINELAKNNPSSSVSSNVQANSKISSLANVYYNYLFSEKITTLNKTPIKFSDFNTSMFFAIDVSMIPEYPEKYGRNNNGKLKVTPFGGTGTGFTAKIGYGLMERPVVGYQNIEKKLMYNRWTGYQPWNGDPRIAYSIVTEQIPVYGEPTFVEKQVFVDRTFSLGGSAETQANLDSQKGSDYFVYVEELSSNLTINHSYMVKKVSVGYAYSRVPIITRYYFSR